MAKKEVKEPTSKSLFGEPVKVVSDEKMKSSEPGLFDYMKMLFSNPKEFSKI